MTKIDNQQQDWQKPTKLAIVGGVMAGSAVLTIVGSVPFVTTNVLMDKMIKISNLSDDEFKQVTDGMNKVLKDTKLADKGVNIKRIPATEAKTFVEKLLGTLNPVNGAGQGRNAAFFDKAIPILDIKANTILLPEKNLSLTAFHEIGHAANANLSKIGKLLQKSRNPLLLGVMPIIALIALGKTKKAPEQNPQGAVDKTTTFIKENAGKLTFAAFLPILIEEAMASIKGNKFAKNAGLSTELLNKISKTNKIGYLTYIGSALLTSYAIYLGVKVKDSIAKPKPVE